MNEPKHGTYDAERGGWYDSGRRGWVAKSDMLGQVIQPARELTESDRQQVAGWGKAKEFKENPSLERLIKLRESDRVEERQQFADVAKGSLRIQLHDYEKAKAEGGRHGN